MLRSRYKAQFIRTIPKECGFSIPTIMTATTTPVRESLLNVPKKEGGRTTNLLLGRTFIAGLPESWSWRGAEAERRVLERHGAARMGRRNAIGRLHSSVKMSSKKRRSKVRLSEPPPPPSAPGNNVNPARGRSLKRVANQLTPLASGVAAFRMRRTKSEREDGIRSELTLLQKYTYIYHSSSTSKTYATSYV